MNAVPVKLGESIFRHRMYLNRSYMTSLDPKRLLANYFMEAGLNSNIHFDFFPKHYGGWEEPDTQVRGSFPGHYMSACAFLARFENDMEMKARGDAMVEYLALCQQESEENWVGSIPPVYLERIARGKWVWAPHYMVHKTFMGLVDMYRFAGNEKALEIADKWADWFYDWTNKFTTEQLGKIADWESGGLMEIWAQLYGITKKEKYRVLMERYYRRNLFDPMLSGVDSLSFKHANTSIPEAQGCACAYEVTGEEKYRRAVEQFWHFAVETRPQYVTGGQSNYEIWVSDLSGALSRSTQEFCTEYNMMRLADYLFRWTQDAKYSDFIERCMYNGVLTQQNKLTGEVCYFLPMEAGSQKKWDGAYDYFYCCYGTMVQAQSSYGDKILYRDGDLLTISQYIPFTASVQAGGSPVSLSMSFLNEYTRDRVFGYELKVSAAQATKFSLRLRVPDWSEKFTVTINGIPTDAERKQGWLILKRSWDGDATITITPDFKLQAVPLGENDSRYAFRYGPVAMAGITGSECRLYGDPSELAASLTTSGIVFADFNGRTYTSIKNQPVNFKLMPLYEITDETYTVYFPFFDKEG